MWEMSCIAELIVQTEVYTQGSIPREQRQAEGVNPSAASQSS